MRGKTILCVFCCCGILLHSNSSQGNELIYAASHWPPWVIVPQEGSITGINIDIVKEIAKRLELDLKIIRCTWKRCLKLVELGEADIIGTILKRPDREIYLHFLPPPYIVTSSRVFYVLKGQKHLIQKYEDLYRMKQVGVVRGVK